MGVVGSGREERIPAQRQVGRRDDLHKVDEVVGRVVRLLACTVERIGVVVVCPLPAVGDLVGELRAETQLVDVVCHSVFFVVRELGVEIVLQVVRVDLTAGEAAAGGDVEVADDLVDAQDALKAAAFAALGVDARRVALPFALLDVGALAKGPVLSCVGFAHFVASVAAAFFDRAGERVCAAAVAAVVWVEVFGDFLFRVASGRTQLLAVDANGKRNWLLTGPKLEHPAHGLPRQENSGAPC